MPTVTVKKVNYLLRRFKNTEWSGPAWYRILKSSKDGFPIKVKLEHFIPIDLGDATSTEQDGEVLGKLLPKVYKKSPELGKCFLGLIHSHHTMGAFFSGTDKDAIFEESSRQGLFFSTVVASEKEKYVTAVGYKDQFGFPNMVEGTVSAVFKEKTEPEWRYEADKIAKRKKDEEKTSWAGHGMNYNINSYTNQRHLFGENVQESVLDQGEVKSLNGLIGAGLEAEDKDTQKEVDERIADQYNKLESNEITEDEFVKEVRDIDPTIEPHWYIDQGWIK